MILMYVFGNCSSDVLCRANTVVSLLNKWFIANWLSLNIDKTSYSVLSIMMMMMMTDMYIML